MSQERKEFRKKMSERRQKNQCTNCGTKTKHFHHFADGHSVCCACVGKKFYVPKYVSDYKLPERIKV